MSNTNKSGNLLVEGKTKIVRTHETNPNYVLVESKDDLTAGDGAKHDVVKSKGELATTTTCNVFAFLKRAGVPVAFDRRVGATHFLAPKCCMLPYEVVVRREAHGSILKREHVLQKGDVFDELRVEFFLKTNGKKWREYSLPCDDPLMFMSSKSIHLYLPSAPLFYHKPILVLDGDKDVFTMPNEVQLLSRMRDIARWTFQVLENAWNEVSGKLVDFKIEFGISAVDGSLLVADVIDSDSWRVFVDGEHADKQAYRDGADLDTVLDKYRLAAKLTSQFKIP